jgi:NodT family efflux transporter outer membrane factor (OMF) lipoprotein
VSAVAALGGCEMVGPDYEAPPVQVNAEWLTAQTAADGSPAPAAPPQEKWWETFSDPVLSYLIRSAYEENLTLRRAGLRVIEARARRGIAVGRFWPQVQQGVGTIGYSHPSEHAISPFKDDGFADASAGLDAAWELDFWGKFRRGIQSADAEVLSAVADYDSALVTLVADVATTYVAIRALEEQIAFSKASVALQADTLALTDTRFKAGAVSELDVTTARATLSDTQALVPLQESDLREAKLALCVLLGRAPSELEEVLAPPPGTPRQVPSAPPTIALGVPAELLRRRPDVRAAERVAAAQSARIGEALADYYPAVSITGSTGFSSTDIDDSRHLDLDDIADHDAWFGFVGLSVNWPILNYGRIESNVRVQDARYERAIAEYQESVLRAAADVESGLTVFLKSRERLAFLTTGVEASQRTVELALIQYRTGAADFIRVNTAQSQLVDQQIAMVQARAATALGAIRAFRALGGGWELRADEEFVDPATVERMTKRTRWGDVLDPHWRDGKDYGFPRPPVEEEAPKDDEQQPK